jgi:hypothetical protein
VPLLLLSRGAYCVCDAQLRGRNYSKSRCGTPAFILIKNYSALLGLHLTPTPAQHSTSAKNNTRNYNTTTALEVAFPQAGLHCTAPRGSPFCPDFCPTYPGFILPGFALPGVRVKANFKFRRRRNGNFARDPPPPTPYPPGLILLYLGTVAAHYLHPGFCFTVQYPGTWVRAKAVLVPPGFGFGLPGLPY